MVPKKLNVMISRFCYAGNGGFAAELPDIGDWLVEIVGEMRADERIGEVVPWRMADTPITASRNRAVLAAKAAKCDLLLMIDSDNVPDYELKMGDKTAKPFWKTAFDFLYDHYDKGPAVIGAPYCGPPPHENVYVFHIANKESGHADSDFSLDQYTRHDAAHRTGIEEVHALPTGLILFDVRAFDMMSPPWFYYEWSDEFQSQKASTEDVTATRDMMFRVQLEYGHLPLYVAWDCWAGHVKPKIVGKPKLITANQVGKQYTEAVLRRQNSNERTMVVNSLDKFLAKGAKMYQAPAKQPSQSVDVGNEPWQTSSDLLTKFGWTPQKDLLAIRRLVQDAATRLGREPFVVELGTYIGQSAKAMADAGAVVFTVDNMEGSPHDGSIVRYAVYGKEDVAGALEQNLGDLLGSKVHRFVCDSVECAGQWKKSIDMLYVDADHDYAPTKANIEAWLPHVREGGIVAGHDYDEQFPGTVKAVNEMFPEGVNVEGQVWWTVKQSKKNSVNRLTGMTHPAYEEDVPEIIANGASH